MDWWIKTEKNDRHQKRTRQVNEPRWVMLPTSLYLWKPTVDCIDTRWTMKTAAITKMSTANSIKVVIWSIYITYESIISLNHTVAEKQTNVLYGYVRLPHDAVDTHASCLGLYQWQLDSSLCVCLVYQWQCQFAAAAGNADDDDDKIANDAVTVWLLYG